MMPEQWVIEIQWTNSTPTMVGPFGTINAAEEYGQAHFDRRRRGGVADWSIWMLDAPRTLAAVQGE